MIIDDSLMLEIRSRFHHVESDPVSGKRIFLESGGGSLVLKSALERADEIRKYPDSEGRFNRGSEHLQAVMDQAKIHLRTLFGTQEGHLIFGATGTELLFRTIRCVLQQARSGTVLSSTLEHSATTDAARGWSEAFGHRLVAVPFNTENGAVTPEHYAAAIHPDTILATVIHTSHVTGRRVDLAGICAAIRSVAPECFIICDGIQHAPHGPIYIDQSGVDAYVYAPYKAYAGRGGAFAWISDRLARLRRFDNHYGEATDWMLGSSDPAFFAAISATHDYLCWLGQNFAVSPSARETVVAGLQAANAHELVLIKQLIHGSRAAPGLADAPGIHILGGNELGEREGAISFTSSRIDPVILTKELERRKIRVYVRDNLPGSSAKSTLDAMNVDKALRISFCHYNTTSEVSEAALQIRDIVTKA